MSASGRAFKNGSQALAGWKDVTNNVSVALPNPTFDRAAGTITSDVYLINTSKKPVSGPVVARILTLSSPLGMPYVLGSANGLSGAGAVLNLSSLLRGRTLPPGAASATKRLTFRLANLRPMQTPNANDGPTAVGNGLLQVEFMLLAHP